MKLHELDKNSKYGYRRKSWAGAPKVYAAYKDDDWVYVNGKELTVPLLSLNKKADDWYLSNIPNKYYKRVAVVTKNYTWNFPKDTRIVQSDDWHPDFNIWVKADYSDDKSTFRSPGIDCEWEDEMGSPFPCFRAHKWNNYTVMFTAENVGEVVHGSDVFNVGHSSSNWVSYNDSVWKPCEDPRQKRKFKVGDVIRYGQHSISSTITSLGKDCYNLDTGGYVFFVYEDLWELVQSTTPSNLQPEQPENTSCSPEPITPKQKENTMDLRLLLAMMAAMSEEETPKDATNSQYVVIVTKDDAYEGYFYSDCLDEVEKIVAKPSNELKKFHVFDYRTTLAQKPRKVVQVERS